MVVPYAANARTTARPTAPPVWYAAAVMGLAAFMVALIALHPPIVGYQAFATVARTPVGPNGDSPASPLFDPATVERWLKSDLTLQRITGGDGSVAEASTGKRVSLSREQLDDLRRSLAIHLDTDGETGQWTVSYLGSEREQAKRIAANAAQVMAEYLDRAADNRPQASEIAALQREVRAALDQEEHLRGEIEQLRHEQLAAVLVRERTTVAAEPTIVKPSLDDAPLAERRLSLQQKIDDLKAEHRKLSATHLTAHPAVAAMSQQIEQLEAQLREMPSPSAITPANVPGRPTQSDRSAGLRRQSTPAVLTSYPSTDVVDPAITLAARLGEVRERLHDVTRQRKLAERRLETATQLAAKPWQKQWHLAAVTPPQRLGGTPHRRELLWAGIVGVIAATLISIDWNRFGRPRVIGTATQARNSLNAPLIGEVAIAVASPPVAPPAMAPLQRRLLRMAEWLLIVSLFLLILAAVSQQDFASQIASDPFGAMAEAFDHWRGLGW